MRNRTLIVPLTVLLVGAGGAAVAAPTPEPQLQLVAATNTLMIERYEGETWAGLNAGTHIVAGKDPFEIWAKRASFSKPITAWQVVKGKKKPIPAEFMTSLYGLDGFLHVTWTDPDGKTILDENSWFCPENEWATRARPDAPARSPYPTLCAGNPFALGTVMGLQAGWSVPSIGYAGDVAHGRGRFPQ